MKEKDSTEAVDWSPVERALTEGTSSGYKIAVLETHKILLVKLADMLPYKSLDDRLSYVASQPDQQGFERAHALVERIVHEPGFDISREDTKGIMALYWKAITALENDEDLPVSSWISRAYPATPRKTLLTGAAVLVGVLLAILFLGETAAGRTASFMIVQFVHTLVFAILPVSIVLVGVVFAVRTMLLRRRVKRLH